MHDIAARFHMLPDKIGPEQYNFKHFRTTHFVDDIRRTMKVRGVEPGRIAPDFELPEAGGGRLRLRSLRGKPVLLKFGSFT